VVKLPIQTKKTQREQKNKKIFIPGRPEKIGNDLRNIWGKKRRLPKSIIISEAEGGKPKSKGKVL